MSTLSAVWLLRIRQWVKNLLVFAPLIFAQKYDDVNSWLAAFVTFFGFSLASSAGYILNDWVDRDRDKLHPSKRFRPIASGAVSPSTCALLFLALSLLSIGLSALINRSLIAVVLSYLAISALYSLILKNIAIAELLLVSLNYVLRVVAGAVALPVTISPWLLVGTFLLALVIVIGKRRAELSVPDSRSVLRSYTASLLDQWLTISAASAIVAYAIYSFQAHPGVPLFLTLPFVIFGVFRYLFLVYAKGGGATPDRELITDPQLLVDVFLWIATTVLFFHLFAVK
ncbi:MAG: decaprenyl-phosphate phosphoribosyltransferase [bacterium JZ-2024 1]